jgi:hypothetical protein
MTRRFPPPWSVRELEQAFVVSDANGQAVAYTYFRRNQNEAEQAHVLTWDEARRIAINSRQFARAAVLRGTVEFPRPYVAERTDDIVGRYC